MCQCLQGDKIDWENLRTPEQQMVMSGLAAPLTEGLNTGATKYPGQLSAPQNAPQQAALQTMMGVGGYPNYLPAGAQTVKSPTTGGGKGSSGVGNQGGGFARIDPGIPTQSRGTGGMAGTGNIASGQPGGLTPAGDSEAMLMQALLGLFSGQGSPTGYDPSNIRRGY